MCSKVKGQGPSFAYLQGMGLIIQLRLSTTQLRPDLPYLLPLSPTTGLAFLLSRQSEATQRPVCLLSLRLPPGSYVFSLLPAGRASSPSLQRAGEEGPKGKRGSHCRKPCLMITPSFLESTSLVQGALSLMA